MLSWEDFTKVDIRVGRIISATNFPQAKKPAYILKIDFGELGIKKSSAQLTANYDLTELEGKIVCAVMNFEPKQIGPIKSEVLVLGLPSEEGKPILITPDKQVPLGGRLY